MNEEIQRRGLKTDEQGRQMRCSFLREDDVVAMAEWVAVPLLSEEAEGFRADITMKEFLKKERNRAINRLCRVCAPGRLLNHYGSIAYYRYCHPIRAVVLEGVWSINRCSYGGPLAAQFQSLTGRMNKRKSAVAIAQKLVTLAWVLMKRREYYNGIDPDTLKKQLRYYKVRKGEPAA